MDKGFLVEKIVKTRNSKFQVTIQTANGALSYTGTIASLDIDSYASCLMLNTDQGNRKISYRSIIEITPV